MDTLERINQLMKERNWTKYKLAQQCGMSLSTVANMFRRNTSPTVSTIETMCKAFGIALSQFFDIGDNTNLVHLTDDQKRLFDRWSSLTAEQKDLFLKLMDNMR